MTDPVILHDIDPRGVATVTLNRPELRNAFNDELIAFLAEHFTALGELSEVRAIILKGAGKCFSAGADLNWMQEAANYGQNENMADAMRLSAMLKVFNSCPKPTLALVHGAAFGGGVGLVACADYAVATADCKFALSEVRLGLTPATISPYVVAAIGSRNARALFLSGKQFSGEEARHMGLVHAIGTDEEAIARIGDDWIGDILASAPGAVSDSKQLITEVEGKPVTYELRELTAERIARRRASREGKEGIDAFLNRRKPNWAAGDD